VSRSPCLVHARCQLLRVLRDADRPPAYASGMIPITKMVRTGVIFDVVGAALCVVGVVVMAKVVGIA
jgi:hypothetical protein